MNPASQPILRPHAATRPVALKKVLLACGILASMLYAVNDVVAALRYEGYSYTSQAVSELSAIGAPTRAQALQFGVVYTLLMLAFSWGIWRFAGMNRPLRVVGGLLLAYCSLGLLWPFAPMHQRGAQANLSDTLHIALTVVTVLLMLLAIGFGAAAFGRRFRLYSIATLIVHFVFGGLAGLDGPRLAANLPTPWLGVTERINIAVFLLWVVVLAARAWRTPQTGDIT